MFSFAHTFLVLDPCPFCCCVFLTCDLRVVENNPVIVMYSAQPENALVITDDYALDQQLMSCILDKVLKKRRPVG